ncbi:MAG: histidinol-phosphate transaminase [Nitrosomonadales bacterium]|jgi:histidinol-phosphate aminotransferase|nr:histidinol-phosphate transaminase [Nitrosomonadales bacterium]MBT4183046.1 histidinol-phosphate transaminase [Nitrosomonadales bacterium]MBT4570931.1 histidinol-phosphate transaminase [Nitrosomonadales bacterium]MBT4758924.1 histidinol-phosphate transaminase [Nitrosomonadales bacterium]MBT5149716.1 histidinol-phosphate transaminase [Nitrosomonadales bacterium]
MSKYWGNIVEKLMPYTPGEQPKDLDLLKLNTNENPFGPSPRVLNEIKKNCKDHLRLYPDPESLELKKSLAEHHNLSRESVFVSNGSDESLAFIFQALLKKDKPILFPDITYSFYPVYCQLYEIKYEQIPLDQNFNINLDDYLVENGGIIFPNPNAPTGIPKSLKDVEGLLINNNHSVIVVDEAYVDFGTSSAIKLINKYENLIVTQSFSKGRSLAGMRLGCAFANPNLIEALNRIKNSFNSYPIDRLAQTSAIASIADGVYFEENCNKVIEARLYLQEQLKIMEFDILPSGANFIFTKHKNVSGKNLFNELRKNKILVRHFNSPERISNYLRITIGTMNQMHKLVSVIKEIVK